MSSRFVASFAALAVAVPLAGVQAAEPADLVLRGGKIVTMDAARPEAEAIAINGDRIVAVGESAEIAAHIGPRTKVLDTDGQVCHSRLH